MRFYDRDAVLAYIGTAEGEDSMKHIKTLLIVVATLLVSLVGCSKETKQQDETISAITTRVASLKGPTSLGLLHLMNQEADEQQKVSYQFGIYPAADEIVTRVVKGEVDIALVPANVAAMLYQKTDNRISVIDINTLGVLYAVEHGTAIQSMADLKGKTICMTGKGTVPEYTIAYLLRQHGFTMDDVTIEFKSEPTEVVAFLSANEEAIGILPQPFVSSAMMQDDTIRIALDLTKEWDAVTEDSTLVTGVTIVRKDFLEEHEDVVQQFLVDRAKSVEDANTKVEETAELSETFNIVKAAVAKSAIPYCNIVCVTGEEMQQTLEHYLETLMEEKAESIGGSLPNEDFYYTGSGQKN